MDTTCETRIEKELADRLDDLRKLWDAYRNGEEEVDDLGSIWEYGLCFDYVPGEGAEYDDDGEELDEGSPGYFRYQLSCGGPSDEFRFYADGNGYDWTVWKVEYIFMDWFDGATRTLHGKNRQLLEEIFQDLAEVGTVQAAFDK